jgi:hypothetical protein
MVLFIFELITIQIFSRIMSEKEKQVDQRKEEVGDENTETANKKSETEHSRRQESRMMNFFNQEFLDRKIDFKPK